MCVNEESIFSLNAFPGWQFVQFFSGLHAYMCHLVFPELIGCKQKENSFVRFGVHGNAWRAHHKFVRLGRRHRLALFSAVEADIVEKMCDLVLLVIEDISEFNFSPIVHRSFLDLFAKT